MDDAKRSVNSSTRDFLAAWWRGDAGPVPYGGCSACCYYDGIPVDKKRDRRRLPYLLTERDADGGLVLQRRADGACAHLGARGCTVYEHRPSACRSFDCRAFGAMGLVEKWLSAVRTHGSQEAGRRSRGVEFARDSPLEGDGFELPVPRAKYVRETDSPARAEEAQLLIHAARTQTRAPRHTGIAPAHPRAT
jgi:Fe-S-cluster containining protein